MVLLQWSAKAYPQEQGQKKARKKLHWGSGLREEKLVNMKNLCCRMCKKLSERDVLSLTPFQIQVTALESGRQHARKMLCCGDESAKRVRPTAFQ